jgi:RimK family alpha-L-glutamate ligase
VGERKWPAESPTQPQPTLMCSLGAAALLKLRMYGNQQNGRNQCATTIGCGTSAAASAPTSSFHVRPRGRLLIAAASSTPTNLGLAAAAERLGLAAAIVSPGHLLVAAGPGDIVLGRIDVLPTLDGPQQGLSALRQLVGRGVDVVNGSGPLFTAHDKLATAITLAQAGLPHPRTGLIGPGERPHFPPPYVVKPRFGSWGRDVERCSSEVELAEQLSRFRRRRWFRRQGALVQELVPTEGRDLRLVVAGGIVVGAIERLAAAGEWRTNVALGAERRPTSPPPAACALAVLAAASIGGDLVGVDLLPNGLGGWVVIELNAAVDFNELYALGNHDVYETALAALLARRSRRDVPARGVHGRKNGHLSRRVGHAASLASVSPLEPGVTNPVS